MKNLQNITDQVPTNCLPMYRLTSPQCTVHCRLTVDRHVYRPTYQSRLSTVNMFQKINRNKRTEQAVSDLTEGKNDVLGWTWRHSRQASSHINQTVRAHFLFLGWNSATAGGSQHKVTFTVANFASRGMASVLAILADWKQDKNSANTEWLVENRVRKLAVSDPTFNTMNGCD